MHRHVWTIESKLIQQSPWELMNVGAPVTELEHGNARLFVQPVIVTYKCGVCGEQKVERV